VVDSFSALCVNCGDAIPARQPVAVAWFAHCGPCAEVATRQMRVLDLRTGGKVEVFACVGCGTKRICHPRWRTRCHICPDERSTGWQDDRGESPVAGRSARWSILRRNGGVPDSVAHLAGAGAAAALAVELARFERNEWTVLAGDVHGLPWYGRRRQPSSHGTWGFHDPCGTLQKMAIGRLDCRACGPRPGSRTHEARREDLYLLYLVRHRGLLKFGVGDERRVRAHIAHGAQVICVLEARHADVITAEKVLKAERVERGRPIPGWRQRRMPPTFGAGTEVVSKRTAVDLSLVLPAGSDVTHRFLSTDL
jgi:hypothetical protein